jgi:nicotinamide-nucleotide amidase
MTVPAPDEIRDDGADLAAEIARIAQDRGLTVAVAESLTGGKIACHLAAAPDASDWFRGGVVAYSSDVKYDVLGVPRGPVISEQCAAAMATGVAQLLDATLTVAATGVGGPDSQEGEPPGTVWVAVASGPDVRAELQCFDGDPADVLDSTVLQALRMLRDVATAPQPA